MNLRRRADLPAPDGRCGADPEARISYHASLKRSRRRYEENTFSVGSQNSAGIRMDLANCLGCGTTVSFLIYDAEGELEPDGEEDREEK